MGKGNDTSAARYVSSEREMVEAVVLHGWGVRARVDAGSKKGQSNTVCLGKRAVKDFWIAPSGAAWIWGERGKKPWLVVSAPSAVVSASIAGTAAWTAGMRAPG